MPTSSLANNSHFSSIGGQRSSEGPVYCNMMSVSANWNQQEALKIFYLISVTILNIWASSFFQWLALWVGRDVIQWSRRCIPRPRHIAMQNELAQHTPTHSSCFLILYWISLPIILVVQYIALIKVAVKLRIHIILFYPGWILWCCSEYLPGQHGWPWTRDYGIANASESTEHQTVCKSISKLLLEPLGYLAVYIVVYILYMFAITQINACIILFNAGPYTTSIREHKFGFTWSMTTFQQWEKQKCLSWQFKYAVLHKKENNMIFSGLGHLI